MDTWNLITQWAAQKETFARSPVKFGETPVIVSSNDEVIPSQGSIHVEQGVET